MLRAIVAAVLRLATGGFALIFVGVGLAWWIAPEQVSVRFRMQLLTGAGLSTQIADLASFFLTLGGLMLCGLASRTRAWLFAALALLAAALVGRLLAACWHGAELPIDMVAVEGAAVAVLSLYLRQTAAPSATEPTVRT